MKEFFVSYEFVVCGSSVIFGSCNDWVWLLLKEEDVEVYQDEEVGKF